MPLHYANSARRIDTHRMYREIQLRVMNPCSVWVVRANQLMQAKSNWFAVVSSNRYFAILAHVGGNVLCRDKIDKPLSCNKNPRSTDLQALLKSNV
jgi:hypothetical protein